MTFSRSKPVLRPTVPIWTACGAIVLLAAAAAAYETYSVNKDATNCRACHGDFRGTAPYISASDGVAWRSTGGSDVNLHDGHRTYMLSGDCGVCHATARFPVYLDRVVGSTQPSCIGCHGQALKTGAGLRQHHYRAGETVCLDCHVDSNPANHTTEPESAMPVFYFTPDVQHVNKPTSSCNTNGSESRIAPPRGLDNDGDGIYDTDDSDCSPTPTLRTTWGQLKIIYR